MCSDNFFLEGAAKELGRSTVNQRVQVALVGAAEVWSG
jgi:hypothetical protein